MRLRPTYLLFGLGLALTACDKGELLDNKAPETTISISEINLTGDDRLRSEVRLRWSGEDVDGWVTNYELSLDGSNWDAVTVQDSTFNFELSPGSDTTDINFYVRAIDNDGLADPTPAYLKVPIRNSAPTAIFDSIQTPPDTGYLAVTLVLDVADLDGEDNLDSIYLKANNGSWIALPKDVSIVTLMPTDPSATGPVTADVYKGGDAQLVNAQLDDYRPGADNIFYLRARDIADSDSPVDTSKVVFITRKTSDLLVIDAHPGGTSPTPEQVIFPALASSFATVDVMDLRSNGGANEPRFWTPTFKFTLSAYDKVFWYADGSDIAIDLLENAAGAIQDYLLNQSGKILINTSFPNTYTNESVIQEFTPVDSISTSVGTPRLPTGSLCVPDAANGTAYDSLEASVFVGRATPFYVKSNAEVLYSANLTITGGWVGPNTVAARLTNGAGNTNVVFLSVQLQQLNGRPAALEGFLNEVLVNEFNW
jgi:hypothetical protein